MLYNFKDTPRDLYERLLINIELNEKWRVSGSPSRVYSYPMRFAPISPIKNKDDNKSRDFFENRNIVKHFIQDAVWTPKFTRNVEIMKGAANGAISPTKGLALRTIGETYEEFIANLYLPEELLRMRNTYEKRVHSHEPERSPGNGRIEDFRDFINNNAQESSDEFIAFHKCISANRRAVTRRYYSECQDNEIKKWLPYYFPKE